MNRIIKFRAWDGTKMHYNVALGENGQVSSNLWTTDNWDIMQFTGLQDSDGNDIYDGDIIECYSAPTNLVHWYYDSWCYQNYHAESLPLGGLGNPYRNRGLLECKVLGNIYQNPDLHK